MPTDLLCEQAQLEISAAHDERREPSVGPHLQGCEQCQRFQAALPELDLRLGRGQTHLSPRFGFSIPVPRPSWQPVAAGLLVGLLVGGLMAGFGRVASVQAHELRGLFDMASPSLNGFSASLRVTERNWHPDLELRQYVGSLKYSAPESLALELVDETDYPDSGWRPNHVQVGFADGDLAVVASTGCPVAALPACQPEPIRRSVVDLKPFDESVLTALEITGPSRSLTWWSGIEVRGQTDLAERAAIQIETTVSGSDLLTAITSHGSWRELHPTDQALVWLDHATLIPLRVEVFANDSAERRLWAGRHGYKDKSGQPIFIVEVDELRLGAPTIVLDLATASINGGFVEMPAAIANPSLPPGFTDHRQGQWVLPDGGMVWLRSWSDGRAWLMIESTEEWSDPHLFGLASRFVEPIELGADSVGYLSADRTRLSVHSDDVDLVVSGSVPVEVLVQTAASLGTSGQLAPAEWEESEVVPADELPPGTLLPDVAGWSIAGLVDGDRRMVLMVGSGNQSVLIESEPGNRLDPPTGPDFSEVEVRGTPGRFETGAGSLAWVEGGRVMRIRSSTVGLDTLLDLAESMIRR